jgi:hypothetical protein
MRLPRTVVGSSGVPPRGQSSFQRKLAQNPISAPDQSLLLLTQTSEHAKEEFELLIHPFSPAGE